MTAAKRPELEKRYTKRNRFEDDKRILRKKCVSLLADTLV